MTVWFRGGDVDGHSEGAMRMVLSELMSIPEILFVTLEKYTEMSYSVRAITVTGNPKVYIWICVLPKYELAYLYFSPVDSFFFFSCLFRAAPAAYGSSQARGRSGALAATLHHNHSNSGSKPHLQPILQLMQRRILNPPSKDRDCAHVLMDTSGVCYCWAMTGTPDSILNS